MQMRVVVWGPGYFGRKWMQEVQRNPELELAGVISRSPERGDELARELELPSVTVFATLQEAVATGVEAVIVALPQQLHREAALDSLEAGLHVLLEKPMAMDLAEAREIVAAQAAHPDQVVMVTQNFRWRPHALAMRKAVLGGSIGALSHVGLACRQAIKRGTTDGWREKMADPYLGDFAIHHFDLIRFITGLEFEEAFAASFRPPGSWLDGHGAAAALLKMTGGVVVSYHGTMVAPGSLTPQEGLITIIGESGMVSLDGKYQVILSGIGDPVPLSQPPIPDGELAYGLRQFVESIHTGHEPETNLADNFKSFAALVAVVESAACGQPVTVPTDEVVRVPLESPDEDEPAS
jgi:predicted dehydrogenase